MRGLLNRIFKKSGKYHLYNIAMIAFFPVSFQVYGTAGHFTSAFANPVDKIAFTGTLPGIYSFVFSSVLLISGIIIFCALRLKKINGKLVRKNEEIKKINDELKIANREIKEQKEAIMHKYSETDKLYGMLFQAADDGLSFFDVEGKLRYANQAFFSNIGYDRESFNYREYCSFLHPDDRDSIDKIMTGLKNKGQYECEIRIKHRDGHYMDFSIKAVQVKDDTGVLLGTMTIARDITKLKKINEDLVKANVEAETSSRLKSSFLANISHEIRTPLNSVVGFSNLLLANDITQEVKEEYIEQINYNSEKLLQIIGDIIDLSRLESSQIEITYEEISVSEIVNEVIEESRQIIKRSDKSITLNVRNHFGEISDIIFTDKIWLKRVLSHLMDNAIKFTLDGSIELSFCKEEARLIFRIKDTGIGISKENLARIFEEFRQEIDGHHRPFEGLGIGLTLAKEVIERMGGTIFVESEKGIGSEFSFSIPYRAAGSTKAKNRGVFTDQSPEQLDWSSKKCLLVDDNKDVLTYLNRTLLDTGVRILTARSGKEAIEIITDTPDIDVVLLDMQMPEMNGIDAAKCIRSIRKDLPIIAQTAFVFEDDKDIILEAGCDACLIKPIRKEHLLTVMSSFIKAD
ncbi:MAG: response regulator [Bacteroidetes bacterium]|jgi:PAS domain S-box-containing protein|nr:response regulator [Bacteroidota bacterium]